MAVHPRVCGELLGAACLVFEVIGSSPRVWGTPWGRLPGFRSYRFIPACVGNSKFSILIKGILAVHPRVCGELGRCRQGQYESSGSSPRVWGTLQTAKWILNNGRFIPACVGNSMQSAAWAPSSPVHPACVGNSRTGPPRSRTATVHPRVCGELSVAGADPIQSGGSSPRVWGTPILPLQAIHPVRFIPACVGNSCSITIVCKVMSVHPRVCGELRPPKKPRPSIIGSSPRVWGTHGWEIIELGRFRFIPACVGNSIQGCIGRQL